MGNLYGGCVFVLYISPFHLSSSSSAPVNYLQLEFLPLYIYIVYGKVYSISANRILWNKVVHGLNL